MDRRILLAASAVAVIIVVFLLFDMDKQYILSTQCEGNITNPANPIPFERREPPLPFHVPIPFFFGILVVLLIPLILLYSNMQVEKKLSASAELLAKLTSKIHGKGHAPKNHSVGRELVARLLEPKEMAIVERLIEQPKGMAQSDIVKMPGMTKLKAHRVVERLKQKGIITVQKDGKTNQIKLDSRTRSILSGLE